MSVFRLGGFSLEELLNQISLMINDLLKKFKRGEVPCQQALEAFQVLKREVEEALKSLESGESLESYRVLRMLKMLQTMGTEVWIKPFKDRWSIYITPYGIFLIDTRMIMTPYSFDEAFKKVEDLEEILPLLRDILFISLRGRKFTSWDELEDALKSLAVTKRKSSEG